LKVVSDPPRSLAALRPELSPHLVAVVHRCLEKDPRKRYANAAELASALEPFTPPSSRAIIERARRAISKAAIMSATTVDSEVVTVTSQDRIEATKAASRKPVPWVVLGAVAAALAAISGLVTFRTHRESPSADAIAPIAAAAAVPATSAALSRTPSAEVFVPATATSASAAPAASSSEKAAAPRTRPVTIRAHLSPPTKSSASDDDIPALR
jgi:hypothetical protein